MRKWTTLYFFCSFLLSNIRTFIHFSSREKNIPVAYKNQYQASKGHSLLFSSLLFYIYPTTSHSTTKHLEVIYINKKSSDLHWSKFNHQLSRIKRFSPYHLQTESINSVQLVVKKPFCPDKPKSPIKCHCSFICDFCFQCNLQNVIHGVISFLISSLPQASQEL